VFWSENLFEMLGWAADEEPPLEDALNVYVEADRPRVERAVETALEAGESFTVEARVKQPDGDVRWLEIRGEPRIEDGEVVTLRGAVHDITGQRHREHVLREMYDIVSSPKRSFDDKVQALLALGRRELDTEYGALSRIRGDEYVFEYVDTDDDGVRAGDVVPVSATNCEIVASTERTLVIGDVARDAPEQTDRAGYTDWGISCYIGAPVYDEDAVHGTFCFYGTEGRTDRFSDWEETLVDLMSSWVSNELQRRQANERLQVQNDQLQRFASIVSHDLRNPLTVAEGRLELAREDCESEHLDAVDRAHDRMSSLIEDLLSLAREGRTIDETEQVRVGDVLRDAWETTETREATLEVEEDLTLYADASRLRSVFENLIRNAVEHGGPDVTVTLGRLPEGFYVEDDGPGVPAEIREDVFDFQVSTAEDGTGIGLAIVEAIARAHGWSVDVESGSDGGTRVVFSGVDVVEEVEPRGQKAAPT
jgi:PAS domain S-box-containing protein